MRRLALIGVAALLAAAGCGSDDDGGTTAGGTAAGGEAGAAAKSEIVGFEFRPEAVTIEAGDSVTWTNGDVAPHTATADDREAFDTGTLRTAQSKRIVFSQPGTFSYFCLFHPFMKGTVTVVE